MPCRQVHCRSHRPRLCQQRREPMRGLSAWASGQRHLIGDGLLRVPCGEAQRGDRLRRHERLSRLCRGAVVLVDGRRALPGLPREYVPPSRRRWVPAVRRRNRGEVRWRGHASSIRWSRLLRAAQRQHQPIHQEVQAEAGMLWHLRGGCTATNHRIARCHQPDRARLQRLPRRPRARAVLAGLSRPAVFAVHADRCGGRVLRRAANRILPAGPAMRGAPTTISARASELTTQGTVLQPCPCSAFGLWSMVTAAVVLLLVVLVLVDRCVPYFRHSSIVRK